MGDGLLPGVVCALMILCLSLLVWSCGWKLHPAFVTGWMKAQNSRWPGVHRLTWPGPILQPYLRHHFLHRAPAALSSLVLVSEACQAASSPSGTFLLLCDVFPIQEA